MGTLKLLKGLSVVLPVIVSTVAALMSGGVTYNMLVQKQCHPTGPPDDINKFICQDPTIIDNITGILSLKGGIQALVAAIGGLSFGLIRDLTGKSKILMYVGVIGETFSTCGSLASAYYWTSSPWILAAIQIIGSGGFGESIMQMGATCIVMAESSPEELPMRMQLYIILTLMTALFGGLVTTVVVTNLGYLWLFALCIGLDIFALLFTIFAVKNKGYERKSLKESKEAVKKVFMWRENVVVVWLMLIALSTAPVIFATEAIYSGKFLQLKFHYSMYQGQVLGIFSFGISIVGAVVGPTILRKVFNLKELSVGIIVCLVDGAAAFMHAFINSEVFLYLGGVAYFMKLASLPIPNNVIKTILNTDELGTYLGINAILTFFLPLGITRLYQEVSSRTLYTWVGAFYFVSSGCFIFLAIIYSVSYFLYVEPKKREVAESEENLSESSENSKRSSSEHTVEI